MCDLFVKGRRIRLLSVNPIKIVALAPAARAAAGGVSEALHGDTRAVSAVVCIGKRLRKRGPRGPRCERRVRSVGALPLERCELTLHVESESNNKSSSRIIFVGNFKWS